MFRTRAATATLVVVAGAAVVLLVAVAQAAPTRFRYPTHRLVITGQYVDHWTLDDPNPCGLVGDGSVTITFQLAKKRLVNLYYDKYHDGYGKPFGSWVVGVPAGGGVGDMPSQLAKGTITLVDNTTQRPPREGDTCEPISKADCGRRALLRAKTVVQGHGRSRLVANLSNVSFNRLGGSGRAPNCTIGQATSFDDTTYSGRAYAGELAIPISARASIAKRRVLRVTGSSHKQTPTSECFYGFLRSASASCTDDVTRKVTATFTRVG